MAAPPQLDQRSDETEPASARWLAFALGGALGTAVTAFLGVVIVIGLTAERPPLPAAPVTTATTATTAPSAAAPDTELPEPDDTPPATAAPSDTMPGTTTPPAGAPGSVVVVATEFAFAPAMIESGSSLDLTMSNEGAIFHNLEFEGVPGFILEADPGVSASGTVTLQPGTYVYFCSVPGHREAGMEGVLEVSGG